MISSDVMRGFNDLLILSLLMKEDSYGYQISQSIRTISGGQYIMKETTLYSAFTRLERAGWIESYTSAESFGKARVYYRITSTGKQAFREKKEEWQLVKQVLEIFL